MILEIFFLFIISFWTILIKIHPKYFLNTWQNHQKTNWFLAFLIERLLLLIAAPCTSLLSADVIKHWPNTAWRGKGLFHLIKHTLHWKEAKTESRGRNLEKNPHYWLASSDLLSYLSYKAQTDLPRDSTTQKKVGPPALINNQSNALMTCPQANLIESVSFISVFKYLNLGT